MSFVSEKRIYRKSPIVIRTFLNTESKNKLMKCIKKCIKQVKKNEKNENKNEKKNKKMEAKLTKDIEKKNKIQEIRKKIKNLTYDEKFDMVALKYSKILNLVHNVYEAIDEIIKIVPNSFYYNILLKGEYKERIPEIVTEIIVN